ncbi:calcium-binding protein [Prochlorococcus marinus]|uniref:calcium-binding protein n=1 Tax=Prochlorococcus TaxID=1218 RepID=UPI0007B37F9C|nr:calcium-binding protein [Prochlorococcus marinus]KZR76554.1 Leukotoxin [Prochlorococcus marinus str. MIT 1323]
MANLGIFAPGGGNLWDDSGYYGKTLIGVEQHSQRHYGALSNDVSVNTNLDSVGAWRNVNPWESWYSGLTGDNVDVQLDIGFFGNIAANPQQVQNSTYFKIITNKNGGIPYSSLSDVWINGREWYHSLCSWQPSSYSIHKAIYAGNDTINASEVEPLSDGLGNRLAGYDGNDVITGSKGNDIIYGMIGSDYIHAGGGDDVIFGGSGHDFIDGNTGSDLIRGGIGYNMIKCGADNARDTIYISADSVKNNWQGKSWSGVNADIIAEIDKNDQLYIYGVEDSTLTYVDNVSHPKAGQFHPHSYSGVGIYSNGTLEAIVTTVGATSSSVDQFTTGII